jgi:hypothetical protein
VGGGGTISYLQYAVDTLCIGEASIDNLWTLKAMLRGFELTSGLKVNFSKSCLIGINVVNDFMENDFYLSFLRILKHVRKEVVRIQHNFLLGGVNGKKKLCWVKWKVMCLEKK